MKKRTKVAFVCYTILSIVYILCGLLITIFGGMRPELGFVGWFIGGYYMFMYGCKYLDD